MEMEKKKVLSLALMTAAVAGIGSYALLSAFFGEGQLTTSTETLKLENYAQQLTKGGVSYSVENARPAEENTVELTLRSLKGENVEEQYLPAFLEADVPENAFEIAKTTPETVAIIKESESRTEPPTIWPLSASIGVAVGLIFAAVWLSRQEIRGNATSMLLEEGLEKMSVRDAEIVGEIMRREEFTIPDLMKKAGTSKITTWRAVKKLVDRGLVKETEGTKPPSRGLGGRGKPSQVYKYVGPKPSEE